MLQNDVSGIASGIASRIASGIESWSESPGGLFGRPEDLARLEAAGLGSFDAWMSWESGALPQRIPQRRIFLLSDAIGGLVLKQSRYNRLTVGLHALWKMNFPVFSGRVEAQRLCELRALGLPVPRPLAYGEDRSYWELWRRSGVVMERFGGEPADDYLARESGLAIELARAVARVMGVMHRAGYCHKDPYLCHWWIRDRAKPIESLGLIDCERAVRFAGGLPRRWQVKDLAAVFRAWPGKAEAWSPFVDAYVQAGGPSWPGLEATVRRRVQTGGRGRALPGQVFSQ